MIKEHEKKGKIKVDNFLKKVRGCGGELETTDHTFFRLSEQQRKIYDERVLKDFIFNKHPLEVWEQENENLAVFYDFENGRVLKIILNFRMNKIYIVTFYILNSKQKELLGK